MRKKCPKCQEELSEVKDIYLEDENIYLFKDVKAVGIKFSLFPIQISNSGSKRTYKEYRFICLKCKQEFAYSTLTKELEKVSSESEFVYSWDTDCLVKRSK